MFSDLKNDYEGVGLNHTSKMVEGWLNRLAELLDKENNFDDTLESTNEHFSKLCGKSYKPVNYHLKHVNLSKFILIETRSNFRTYQVFYRKDGYVRVLLYTYPGKFEKYDEIVVDIWEELKKYNVDVVHKDILERQIEENKKIEQDIRQQLDKLSGVENRNS